MTTPPRPPRLLSFRLAVLLGFLALLGGLSGCFGTESDTPAPRTVQDTTYGITFTYPGSYSLYKDDTTESHLYSLHPRKGLLTIGFHLIVNPVPDTTAPDTAGIGDLWSTFRSFVDPEAIRDTVQHPELGQVHHFHGIQELEDEDGAPLNYAQDQYVFRIPRALVTVGYARPERRINEGRADFEAFYNSIRLD